MSCGYYFCPFCANSNWTVDKSGSFHDKTLQYHRCQKCKKFTYNTYQVKEVTEQGLEIFQRKFFSIIATVDEYIISVFYHNNSTQFQDESTREVILVLDQAIQFNWYKQDELIKKIKTYVVFS